MFYVTFLANNRAHLVCLRNKIQSLIGIKGRLCNSGRVERLRYAKKESQDLIRAMYKNHRGLYLNRKYDKILKILETNAEVEKFGKLATLRR